MDEGRSGAVLAEGIQIDQMDLETENDVVYRGKRIRNMN
jgi:hypothetical protein